MSELHDRLSSLFLEATAMEPAVRKAFLERVRASEPELAEELAEMLEVAAAPPELITGTFAELPHSESVGGTVGPYVLGERLGEGGMGVVFRATQTTPIRREVAIKLIRPGFESGDVLSRFESERRALGLMNHPCVARVLDGGETADGRPYFAMELVEGIPITRFCDRERLSLRQRLELFARVCDGVLHAHQKGVIHRDLKPTNILVARVDERPVPKIIDFGVAKALDETEDERERLTRAGQLIGTPEYLSPEQAMPGPETPSVDTRTDVYGLGVVLYELLCGTVPFKSDGASTPFFDDLRRRIHDEPPLPPSRRVPAADRRRLRGDLDWIVLKALQKDPERRYATAGQLAQDVRRRLAHEPVAAGPPGAGYRTAKFIRRHRLSVIAAAVVAASLAIGTFTLLTQRRIQREARTATALANLLVAAIDPSEAVWLRGQGPDAMDALTERTLEVADALDDQPVVQAALLGSVGGFQRAAGRPGRALPLLEESWRRFGAMGRSADANALRVGHTLAGTYFATRRFTDAERVFRQVLSARTRTLGKHHVDTLTTATQLGFTVKALERHAEAAEILEDACSGLSVSVGEQAPRSLVCRGLLAGVYLELRRVDAAAEILSRVREPLRESFGDDHVEYGAALYNLAAVASLRGDAERALTLLDEAASILFTDPRSDPLFQSLRSDPRFVRIAERSSLNSRPARDVLRQQYTAARYRGDLEEAEELSSRLLAAARAFDGPHSTPAINAAADLATLYVEQRRYDEAAPLLEEIVRMREETGDETFIATERWLLALCRLAEGDRVGAAGLLRAAAELHAGLGGTLEEQGYRYYRIAWLAVEGRVDEAVAELPGEPEARSRFLQPLEYDLAMQLMIGHPEFERWRRQGERP